MNIHLGLALALIVAGAVMAGLSLTATDQQTARVPWSEVQHDHVESAVMVSTAGQG